MKSLDPNNTPEWVLNDRIADKIEKLLQDYTGYELLRTDDTTGEKDISLTARTNAANNFKADFYLSIHHNAGIDGGKGGGIVAYTYIGVGEETKAWQKALYDALIEATGLIGNRAHPLREKNLHECRETKMPAVLLELGFMDSTTDVPIILSEDYANKCAKAIVKVLVERGGLVKKSNEPTDAGKLSGDYAVEMRNLKKGCKGEDVQALQILLIGRGYSCGKDGADGDFGTNTDKALRAYQGDHGRKVDGIAGEKTMSSLLGVI